MRCPLDVEAEMPNPQLEVSDEKSGTGRHVLSCLRVGGVERHVQVEVIMAVSAEGWTQGAGVSHSPPSGEDGETTEQRRLRKSGRRAREGPGKAGPGKVAEEVKLTNVKCRGQLACSSCTRSNSCPYHCRQPVI